VLLFLILFAVQFAAERLYSDSGYYLARVINEGTFRIEHGRYVLALAQILPLLGSKLGIPMNGLILLHSLNNVAFLAICIWFAARVLKNDHAAIALAAVHLIGLTHGLFCPVFELYYGVDLLILFHAVLRTDRLGSPLRWTLLAVFFVGSVSSHFFAALLALGLLAQERIWRERRVAIVLALLFFAQLALRFVAISVYESSRLETLFFLGDAEKMMEVVRPSRLIEFARYLFQHYLDVTLLAIATAVFLGRMRKWLELGVFIAGLIMLHLLTTLYLPGFLHDRYREQINFVSTAWVVLVLCIHVLPHMPWRGRVMAMLLAACVFRMVSAELIASHYAARTTWIEERITRAREHDLHKAIVPAPVLFGTKNDVIDLSWSTSVESLLLSAREGPDATVSLITAQDTATAEVSGQLDRFIFRRWDILDPAWLAPRYFVMPEGRYTPLPEP